MDEFILGEDEDGGAESAPVFASDNLAFITVGLQMHRARSDYIVQRALAENFPAEEDFAALFREPDFADCLAELAQVIEDIKSLSTLDGAYHPDRIAQAIEQHYGRAVESIEPVAERLGVPVQDLLSFLVNT